MAVQTIKRELGKLQEGAGRSQGLGWAELSHLFLLPGERKNCSMCPMLRALHYQGIGNTRFPTPVRWVCGMGGTLLPSRPSLKKKVAKTSMGFALSGAADVACVVLGSAGGEHSAPNGADGRKELSPALKQIHLRAGRAFSSGWTLQ